jgi:hypothetical protein
MPYGWDMNDAAATTAQPPATVYEIPAERLSLFKSKMDALIKRAARLGFEPPTYTVGQSFDKIATRHATSMSGTDTREWIEAYPVTVFGSAPQFEGWSFMATADYEDGAAEPIFRSAVRNGAQIPERYRTLGPLCEHCNKIRSRKACYLLMNTDGSIKQVGKSCLRDFLGHASPENIASLASVLLEIRDLGSLEDLSGLGGGSFCPATLTYLAWVVCEIRENGWLPRSKADGYEGTRMATADAAMSRYGEHREAAKSSRMAKCPAYTAEDMARAQEALAWARAVDTAGSDYLHNVRVAARRESVGRNDGLIASIIAAYDRAMERTRERGVSEYVGTVGQRLRGIKVVVDRVINIEGFSSSRFSSSDAYLHLMRDEAGNRLVWKSTSATLEVGRTYMLTGTVKQHEDHAKYGKQTKLTRCTTEMVTFTAANDATEAAKSA